MNMDEPLPLSQQKTSLILFLSPVCLLIGNSGFSYPFINTAPRADCNCFENILEKKNVKSSSQQHCYCNAMLLIITESIGFSFALAGCPYFNSLHKIMFGLQLQLSNVVPQV